MRMKIGAKERASVCSITRTEKTYRNENKMRWECKVGVESWVYAGLVLSTWHEYSYGEMHFLDMPVHRDVLTQRPGFETILHYAS